VFGFDRLKRRWAARGPASSQQPIRRATICMEQLDDRLVPSGFTNGNFEGGTQSVPGIPQDSIPAGWQLGPPSPASLSNVSVTNVVDSTQHLHAADGSGNYVRFQSTASNGTKDCLFQDFDTVAGQQYKVTFSVALTSAGAGNNAAIGLNPVWDENLANQTTMGSTNFYFAPTSAQGPIDYQTFSFTETASSTTTRIDFHATDNAGSILLDDVSVVPVTSVQPPTANAQSVSVAENVAKAITLTGSDPNTPALPLTFTVTSAPMHGTLSGTAPNLIYTPNAGYLGPDSFQFTDSNGSVKSGPATVSISVAAHPTITPSTMVIQSTDTTLTINGSGFDPNPANDSVSFVGGATGQVTAATATSLTVTHLTGTDAGPLLATVTVRGVSAPVAQVATVSPDVVVDATAPGQSLVLTVTDGGVSYSLGGQPPVTLHGVNSFTFTGTGASDVTVNVSASSNLSGPVALADETGPISLVLNAPGQQVIAAPGITLVSGNLVTVTVTGQGVPADISATTVNTFAAPDMADRSSAFAGLSPDERFVQALYLDNLGRPGVRAELDGWVSVLRGPGGSALGVASDILHSSEARDSLVKSWYQAYLGRAATGSEEQGWVNLLLQGQLEEQVLADILGSPEFFARAQTLVSAGTAQQRYVQALYQTVLGRAGADSEVAGWVSALAQVGSSGVALDILQSGEARVDLIEGDYVALLHRGDDPLGLQGFAHADLDAASVRLQFEASQEFSTNG
jgi:hypothetical protein